MLPKPQHLSDAYGAQFQDASIVQAYPNRPPYPAETFEILAGLATDRPQRVLDVGCGTGDIARFLVEYVEQLDAEDISEPMLAAARLLPNGDHPCLRWLQGRVEAVPLSPPYALITAGESLHWLDWEITLPLFRQLLSPHGYLAIIGRAEQPIPWRNELFALISRYTTNKDYQPYNVVEELEKRHLFGQVGQKQTAPRPFTQSIEDYIEAIHSRNGFSRQRMSTEEAAAFDRQYRELLQAYCPDGFVHIEIVGTITWGRPL